MLDEKSENLISYYNPSCREDTCLYQFSSSNNWDIEIWIKVLKLIQESIHVLIVQL